MNQAKRTNGQYFLNPFLSQNGDSSSAIEESVHPQMKYAGTANIETQHSTVIATTKNTHPMVVHPQQPFIFFSESEPQDGIELYVLLAQRYSVSERLYGLSGV